MGHSFGGLLAQILAGRGLSATTTVPWAIANAVQAAEGQSGRD
jgi:hypothetical protein